MAPQIVRVLDAVAQHQKGLLAPGLGGAEQIVQRLAYSTSAARAAIPWWSGVPHIFCSLLPGTRLTTAPLSLARAV